MTPRTPRPTTASNPSTFANPSSVSRALRTIASPSGCSDPVSRAAARSRTRSAANPGAATTAVTAGLPRVRVPVLSMTTVSIRPAASRASPPRTRIPVSAPLPVPTMIAVGVARPMAHGQAMMTTPMNAVRASVRRGSGPAANQITNVTTATTITAGTKISLIRSARRWIGALEPCARWTSSTIRASAVSRPTRVARMTNEPVVLTVAPMTSSPAALVDGIGSPVSMDSSTADIPSTTTPSTGTLSPGRTRSRSPGTTIARSTSSSIPSRIRRAVVAWSPTRRRIAPVVLPLARASSHRPRRISPMMIAAESKYVSGCRPASWTTSGHRVTTTEYDQAAVVPRATSVSIVAPPCRPARQAAR